MTLPRVLLTLVLGILLILPSLPSIFGSYAVTVFTLIFFYGFLGQAWNIVGGYAGQLSAGHAAFVGVGAYTAALLSQEAHLTPWVGMLIGGGLAAALGGVIGYLGFRFGLRGFYFVLLTVAFAELCRIVASNVDAIGGALGYYITFTGNPRQFQFQDSRAYYYIALGFMLLATGVAALIERRRFGIYLTAIREDESACEALGVDTFKVKMLAMVVSSFLTGVGGTFYAFYLFSLQPNTVFGIPLSVEIVIRPIVGGAGTLLGPIVGSFILSPLAELSRAFFARGGWIGAHLVVYGLLLVLVVLFLPQGAYPAIRRCLGGERGPRSEPPPAREICAGNTGARTRRHVTALLEVRALSKRYGGLQAVRDLSFTVGETEIVALIGPNGAGKTTVFALLSGFLVPDRGEVLLRGRSIVGLKPHQICALGLTRTFQIVRPFPRLSVLRNVMIGALARHPDPGDARAHAEAVLGDVGLTAKRAHAAGGLTLAERKRLELARALATEPAVLLLDEVMAGLNAAETERIVELVLGINRRGVSIVLIEHVMRAVMSLSRRIVVINYGERIAEGAPDAVANDPKVIEAYLGDAAEG